MLFFIWKLYECVTDGKIQNSLKKNIKCEEE